MKRLLLLVLCVAMLLPILGCGQTKAPSESEPVQENIPESSIPEESTPESAPEATESKEPPAPENSKTEAEDTYVFVERDADIDFTKYNIEELFKADYQLVYDVALYTFPRCKTEKDSEGTPIALYALMSEEEDGEKKLLFEGEFIEYYRVGDTVYVCTRGAIHKVTLEDKEIVYEAEDAISAFKASKQVIFFIEGGTLKAMRPDGSELTEIAEVGTVDSFNPLYTSMIRYEKFFRYGEQITAEEYGKYYNEAKAPFEEEYGNTDEAIDKCAEAIKGILEHKCYIIDLSAEEFEIREVNQTQYYKTSIERLREQLKNN